MLLVVDLSDNETSAEDKEGTRLWLRCMATRFEP